MGGVGRYFFALSIIYIGIANPNVSYYEKLTQLSISLTSYLKCNNQSVYCILIIK